MGLISSMRRNLWMSGIPWASTGRYVAVIIIVIIIAIVLTLMFFLG